MPATVAVGGRGRFRLRAGGAPLNLIAGTPKHKSDSERRRPQETSR